jgi:hypothetical protein
MSMGNDERLCRRNDNSLGPTGWGMALVAALFVLGLIFWGLSGPTDMATNNPPLQSIGRGGKVNPPAPGPGFITPRSTIETPTHRTCCSPHHALCARKTITVGRIAGSDTDTQW